MTQCKVCGERGLVAFMLEHKFGFHKQYGCCFFPQVLVSRELPRVNVRHLFPPTSSTLLVIVVKGLYMVAVEEMITDSLMETLVSRLVVLTVRQRKTAL